MHGWVGVPAYVAVTVVFEAGGDLVTQQFPIRPAGEDPSSRKHRRLMPPRRMNAVTIVWLILTGATLVSWFLSEQGGPNGYVLIGSVILIVAFVKVRLVGSYFMELRRAPLVLRTIFDCYCVLTCGVLIGIFSLM